MPGPLLLATRLLLGWLLDGDPLGRHLFGWSGLQRLGLSEAHLELDHLQLSLGVEPLYIYLGGGDLALGLAGAELAYRVGLVGGLPDRLSGLLQVPRRVG